MRAPITSNLLNSLPQVLLTFLRPVDDDKVEEFVVGVEVDSFTEDDLRGDLSNIGCNEIVDSAPEMKILLSSQLPTFIIPLFPTNPLPPMMIPSSPTDGHGRNGFVVVRPLAPAAAALATLA